MYQDSAIQTAGIVGVGEVSTSWKRSGFCLMSCRFLRPAVWPRHEDAEVAGGAGSMNRDWLQAKSATAAEVAEAEVKMEDLSALESQVEALQRLGGSSEEQAWNGPPIGLLVRCAVRGRCAYDNRSCRFSRNCRETACSVSMR